MLSRRRSSFGWFALVVPSWVPHHPWAQRAYVAAARTVARLRPGSWRTAVLMPRRDGVSEAALRRALDELPHGERYMLAEGLVGHRKPYAPVEDPHLGGAPRRRGHDATDEPGELERAREIVAAWGVQIRPGYWRDEFTLAPCRFQPDGVPEFGEFGTVAGMVGRGHEAYVRILHPVSAAESGGGAPRRWADLPGVSAADVREPGWRPDLDDEGRRYAKPEFNDTLPEGWIPLEVRRGLMSVLTAYRAAEVVQAAWVGRCVNVEGATDVRIEQPERELVPFIGRFDEIVLFDDDVTPALMFPVAGGWVVGCDVDTVSTYLGCSAELAGKVLTCSGLEAVVARPEDPIG